MSGFVVRQPDPHEPKQALATMRVPAGFSVQQFAAEPFVVNPTNMEVDDQGRVWATESPDYDVAPAEADPKGDKVIILEDVNHDGRADKRTVFFEHPAMKAPMGLLLGHDRVYLAQAPYLLMLFDTDQDDRADKVDTLFSGFGKRDHGIHAPFWGPDGKLYFSMGNHGGEVRDKNGKPLRDREGNLINGKGTPYRNGLIVRCNPDGSDLETIAHNFRNQYEAAFDSFGNLWVTDNDDDGNESVRLNYVMEHGNYGFADEMTGASWTTERTNSEKNIPDRHWHQNDPGVIPNVLIMGSGSPAGLCFYEGNMFPDPYRGQLLHAEALHNVVRQYRLATSGSGYSATLNKLLSSTQQWFRPVDVSVAPDGSVFVADWYDPGIGGGTAADAKKGRIYRISYGKKHLYTPTELTYDTPEQAVKALLNPNWCARNKGFRSLVQSGRQAGILLEKVFQGSHAPSRARALWVLDRLMPGKYLPQALQDANPAIRLTALRAAERQAIFPFPVCQHLTRDPDPAVRREWAIALRSLNTPAANEAWASLAGQYKKGDRWFLEALGLGADRFAADRFAVWQKQTGMTWQTAGNRDIIWRMRAPEAMPLLAQLILKTDRIEETLRYFRAFDFHQGPGKNEVLQTLLSDPRPAIRLLALSHIDAGQITMTPELKQAIDQALVHAGQTETYTRLVGKFNLRDKQAALMGLVTCCAATAVGQEALQLLRKSGEQAFIRDQLRDNATAEAILIASNGNSSQEVLTMLSALVPDDSRPVELRKLAVRTMGSSWIGERYLLDEVARKNIPEVLKSTAASVLFGAFRNEIKREAALYLPEPAGKNGEPLPPVYLLAYEKGNAAAGKSVFTQNCRSCHRIGQAGVLFGPELSKIGAKLSKEGLFRAVLFPDEGINHGYETYRFRLSDGSEQVGLIGSESNEEISVKLPGGYTQKIRKPMITDRAVTGQSMMPSFAEVLTRQELVDLVAYLKNLN